MKTFKTLLAGAGLLLLCACSGTAQQAAQTAEQTDQNAVVDAILARRSIRKYTDQPVEREKLDILAQCAINAPSGMNQQPWQVRVVDSKEYIDGITELYKAQADPRFTSDPDFKNMFRNAPAVIFIASPKDGRGVFDCGLLAENIMVAAVSLDLGTVCLGGPIHFMKESADAKPYVDRLNLPDDYELLYAIGIGYPDEAPDAKPRDAEKWQYVD